MKHSPRKLLNEFGRRKAWILILVVLAGAVRSILNILLSLSVGVFYSIQFGDSSGKSALLNFFGAGASNLDDFFTLFWILLAFRVLFGALAHYGENLAGDKFVEFLRNLLFEHQLRARANSIQNQDISRKVLKQSTEMNALRALLVKGILGLTSDVIFISASLILLSILSPELTVLTLIVLASAVAASVAFGYYLRKFISRKNDRRFELLKWAESGLRNLFALKILNRERMEAEQFVKRNARFVSASLALHRKNSLIEAWMPATFFGLLGLIMWKVSVDEHLSETVDGGKLVTFILLLFYIQGSLRRVMRTPSVWQKGMVSFTGLSDDLNLPLEKRTEEDHGRDSKGLIQLRDVDFEYADGEPVFRDLNLSVHGSGLTWVYGKTGRGKSTLFRLMTFFLQPSGGAIALDGVNYEKLTAFAVRKKMAVISQDVPLMGSTVFEAISFSQKEDKKASALQTLTELGVVVPQEGEGFLHKRISSITSRGTLRKLELARALLTRKSILLMDEPFVGLSDPETTELAGIINRLASHKTVVIFSSELPDKLQVHKKIELP